MIKVFILLGGLFLYFNVTIGQNNPPVSQVNIVKDQQWEYLVITFGKALFGSPEKTLAYKTVGIDNGNEATNLQSNFDILGRFGWELISVLGVIGGDQQIILKRKYDKARSANEYGLIQNGKELYLKDLQDIIQRSLRLSEEQKKLEEQYLNKAKLINLDEVERSKKREELKLLLKNSYTKRFEQTEISKNATFSFEFKSAFSSDILITINVDLTGKFLINGNSYHGDEISSYLNSFARSYRFTDPAIDKYTAIKIEINGFIMYNEEKISVGSMSTQTLGSSDSWY